MKLKERIAALEARVAELEAWPSVYVYPAPSNPWVTYGPPRCPRCGTVGYSHACWTSTFGDNITPAYAVADITYIGAAS